jgi:phosphoglycolate phosphatase
MIRLALFDIDGTLIRTGGAGVRAFDRTGAAEFEVVNGTAHMRFAGRTDSSLVRELFHSHGIAPAPDYFGRFYDRYVFLLDHYLSQSQGRVCHGAIGFLDGLRNSPQPPLLGLLTGNIRLGAEIKLRHYGLWDWFETGAFGDDHEDRNQLARIALSRGEQLLGGSLEPGEVLVVGDTPHDVTCGRVIGARVLAVTTGGATRSELQASQPDWIVDSLDEVPVARFL